MENESDSAKAEYQRLRILICVSVFLFGVLSACGSIRTVFMQICYRSNEYQTINAHCVYFNVVIVSINSQTDIKLLSSTDCYLWHTCQENEERIYALLCSPGRLPYFISYASKFLFGKKEEEEEIGERMKERANE